MSSTEITTLEAIEQKVVYFLEDELVAARAEDGHIYVSLRHLCQALGLDMLRVDLVPLWLSGISTRSLKQAEIRAKLEKYQAEAAKVLWKAFQDGRLTTSTTLDDLLTSDSPAAQAYKMASAIMRMAQQQLLLDPQLESHTSKLTNHETRLESAVAQELGKQTKRNEYGGVYGELYRHYGINSYKSLPKNKFDHALNWLNEWLQSLISDTPF